MSKQLIGVLALLVSSVGSAASLVVTPSTLTPGIGNSFTVALDATGMSNVGGITLLISWNTARASLTTSALAGSGPIGTGECDISVPLHESGAQTPCRRSAGRGQTCALTGR